MLSKKRGLPSTLIWVNRVSLLHENSTELLGLHSLKQSSVPVPSTFDFGLILAAKHLTKLIHRCLPGQQSNNGTPNRGSGDRYSKNPSSDLKESRSSGSASGSGQQKVVVALYTYEARADGDLSFRKVR